MALKWFCPNGCEIDHVIVCGGDPSPCGVEGNSDGHNVYFQMNLDGKYTNLLADGTIGVPEYCYNHADGGCCTEPQCPECLAYCEQVTVPEA